MKDPADLQHLSEQEAYADAQRVVLDAFPDARQRRWGNEEYDVVSRSAMLVLGDGMSAWDAWMSAAEYVEGL